MVDKETLGQYAKIVVETDEENLITIAVIQSKFRRYRQRLQSKINT